MHSILAGWERREKKRSFSARNIISRARVRVACKPLTEPTFVPSFTLLSPPEGPARDRFTPLRTSSLTFRRATNPRTGNDWQPFRSRHGLASSMQGTFARRKQFRIRRRLFARAPTSRLSDLWRHNLRAGLIHDLNISRREERDSTVRSVENWKYRW